MFSFVFWEAVATMIGCIVGAGIFGLPYVIAQAGFLTGALNIIIIGFVVLLLYLYLGEVILRTNGKHQLTGYAEKYLGRWGKRAMAFSMVFGVYGALTAYLIGVSDALQMVFGGQRLVYMALFFIISSGFVYYGLEAVEKSELFVMFLIFLVVIMIIIFTFPHINIENLKEFSLGKIFIPYGVVLFAYLGMISIPEVSEILGENRRKMKKVMFVGLLIPIILYLVFSLVVVGSVGLNNFNSLQPNERLATMALGKVVSPALFIIANIFAVFAMFTSFMAVGLALKEMFMYDYGIGKKASWALTCFVPLGIALSSLTNFIEALNIVGIIVGGIDAVLIVFMFHRAKKLGERTPEYTIRGNVVLSALIIILFMGGMVSLLI